MIYLKPWIHKIKGYKNFALYDLLNEKLYSIIPEGSIDDLKKKLFKFGLICVLSTSVCKVLKEFPGNPYCKRDFMNFGLMVDMS